MRWLVDFLFGRRTPERASDEVSPRSTIDREALREQMTCSDPDMAEIRAIQHDALSVLAIKSLADGLALRRERRFWQQQGDRSAPRPTGERRDC